MRFISVMRQYNENMLISWQDVSSRINISMINTSVLSDKGFAIWPRYKGNGVEIMLFLWLMVRNLMGN